MYRIKRFSSYSTICQKEFNTKGLVLGLFNSLSKVKSPKFSSLVPRKMINAASKPGEITKSPEYRRIYDIVRDNMNKNIDHNPLFKSKATGRPNKMVRSLRNKGYKIKDQLGEDEFIRSAARESHTLELPKFVEKYGRNDPDIITKMNYKTPNWRWKEY